MTKHKGIKLAKNSLLYIGLAAISVVIVVPILFVLFTALKSRAEFYDSSVFAFPKEIYFQNFIDAWTKGRMGRYILNTLIVCVLKVPLGILVEAMAAFAITRLNLKWSKGWFVFFLVGMMIPVQVTLVPLNIALTKLHLTNTYTGLFIVYIAFGIPFGILVLRGFMRAIPREMDEAARIDGCNTAQHFFRVILPMCKAPMATLLIMDFLSTWNEYVINSIIISDQRMRTVPSGRISFIGEFGIDYGMLTAAMLASIIPVLIVYLIFQKHFVEGMSGAVKG